MKKKRVDPAEFEMMQELKKQTVHGPMVEVNRIDDYKIMIINRGEQLFYQQGDKAFVCEIQVRNDLIYQDSIKRWDTGEAVNSTEKQIILNRILNYFKVYQQSEAKVI